MKKQKKVILKSPEELLQEAHTVKKIISETPVIPEKEGELYHIVSMEWFIRWKKYTGFDKIKNFSSSNFETPGGGDDQQSVTTMDEDNMLSDEIEKLHIHKEQQNLSSNGQSKAALANSGYPGPINDGEDFDKLLVDDVPFLKHPNQQED